MAPAITASLDPSSPSGTVGILTSAPTPNVPILVFDVKSTVSGSLQTAVINLIPSVRGGTTPLGPQKVFFAIQLQAAGRAYSPSSVTAAGVVFSNMQIPLSAGQSVPVTVLVTAPQDTADGFFNGTVASPQVNPANLAATDASGQAIPPSGASVVGNTLTFSTQVSFISGSSLTANLHDGFSAWLQSVIGW